MNIADGELMQGILGAGGFDVAHRPEDADVILVNTCAIREHAEQRVLGRVGELNRIKTTNPDVVIGVTGCMAQRLGETLLERAPYVDLVMGPDGYRGLPQVLAKLRPEAANGPAGSEAGDRTGPSSTDRPPATARPAAPAVAGSVAASSTEPRPVRDADVDVGVHPRRSLPVLASSGEPPTMRAAPHAATIARGSVPTGRVEGRTRLAVLELAGDENYEGLEVRRTSSISAWVPVQRGCNYRCTYCIVPYVRGPEKNRAPEHVLDEVKDIAARGITEVVLLGQTVNSYEHGDWRFPRLLRAIARLDGIRRVRFTSPHPNDVTPELVDVMATEPAVCKQLHLPVQSGHDRTLKRMVRRYTVAAYLEKVRLVRESIPGIALSTDIIVAFPGETEEEYQATLDLVREVRYDDAFLYKYSLRDGTPATRLPADQFIAPDVAQSRLERLIALQRSIQASINESELGRVVEALVERRAKSHGDMLGRTDGYKVVAFPGDETLVGRYVDVRLTGTTGATFRGERVDGGLGRVA
jgi:MiaB/RimO family radical SAM methylthiotransferase